MSNGFETAILKQFVSDIERHHDTIASYKGEHAQRVKSVQELITEVFDRAKDAGIPRKELKAVIKERRLLVQTAHHPPAVHAHAGLALLEQTPRH